MEKESMKRTHGRSKTPEHRAWGLMKSRCLSPTCPSFPYYGGRGVTVCDRWLKFENFFADMGMKPTPSHTLDRIDSKGNYEPGNCRWATRAEQARNKRYQLFVIPPYGDTRVRLFDLATSTGLDYDELYPVFRNMRWLESGNGSRLPRLTDKRWPLKNDQAMTCVWTPPKTHCKHGHELTPENTFQSRTGRPTCKKCRSDASLRWYYKSNSRLAPGKRGGNNGCPRVKGKWGKKS